MEKYHKTDIYPVEKENERDENYEATNPQIASEITRYNYHTLDRKCPYTKFINKRIDELNLPTKPRKDAVLMASFVIGSDGEFFKGLTPKEQSAFFTDCTRYFADKYGEENMISAIVHVDETTPHMHLNLMPIKNGRLCCKDLFNRTELTKLQTDFHEAVGKRWGLERGKEGSSAKHLSTAEFKAEKIVLNACNEAESITESAQAELKQINKAVEKAETHFDDTVKQIHNAKAERDKIVAERDSEADYSQALEQAKNGEIAHSKSGMKAQIVALTVENKSLSEENAILLKDNDYLFESYKKEKRTHKNYDKALSAISLFRTQEPEAFARVFFRATSILQPLIPADEQPASLPRNRLQEIEDEIRKEQEQNTYEAKKNSSDKGGK
ncbi:MAG: plasmid recombination protein [Clostridia bacterium]|nr:plasmid recombination protein [Clostridia bacterium]